MDKCSLEFEMMETYWPSIMCALCAVGLLWAEVSKNRPMQWAFKPAAAFMFVLQAVLLGAWETTFGLAIFAGLCLCMLGDVLLIKRESEPLFKAGIGAFLLGHVAYISAFSINGIAAPSQGLRFIVLLFGIIGVSRWLMRHVSREMLLPVGLYIIVITGMVYTSWGAVAAGASGAVGLAACLFAISDIAVARDRFVHRSVANAFVITPLYFAAQILFAISV